MTIPPVLETQLDACAWYRRQPEALKSAIVQHGRVVTLAAWQTAYLEGDENTGLWIILAGELRLHMSAGHDASALFATARAGTLFGRSRVGGADARIVTAVAGEPSRALLLSDRAIERIAADHPAMWRALADALHMQLDTILAALGQMLLLRPRARIAARLLALGVPGGDGEPPRVELSQADLGEMCGLSRKSINGHLGALEQDGLIARHYVAIILRDQPGLRRVAQGEQ